MFNGGELHISKNMVGTSEEMVSAVNLGQQKISILGSQFAGEMKKALMKMSSFILPRKGLLPLRGSAFTF
jgi:phosphoenolpyruvate carboxykinase (ATP)